MREFLFVEVHELEKASAQVYVSPIVGWLAECGCVGSGKCQKANASKHDWA